MVEDDLADTALVHQLAFPRQGYSREWLECNFNAFPRYIICVAEINDQITGYIIWVQKSGFRPEAIVELEQLAVLPVFQGQGIGRNLITESLVIVKEQLATKDSVLKHILVTTRADNYAQDLYESTLGAKVESVIPNLYSADEVLMIARNVS